MNRFKFYLVKSIWFPRQNQLKKTLVIMATDAVNAYQEVTEKFPNWEVSMFWPEWS